MAKTFGEARLGAAKLMAKERKSIEKQAEKAEEKAWLGKTFGDILGVVGTVAAITGQPWWTIAASAAAGGLAKRYVYPTKGIKKPGLFFGPQVEKMTRQIKRERTGWGDIALDVGKAYMTSKYLKELFPGLEKEALPSGESPARYFG